MVTASQHCLPWVPRLSLNRPCQAARSRPAPAPGDESLRGGCESWGQGTNLAVGPAAHQPHSGLAEPFAGSVARGIIPHLPSETCFSSLSPMATSWGGGAAPVNEAVPGPCSQCLAGRVAPGWGTLPGPRAPVSLCFTGVKATKTHIFESFAVHPFLRAVSGMLRASPQPGDEDGDQGPMSPWSLLSGSHHPM